MPCMMDRQASSDQVSNGVGRLPHLHPQCPCAKLNDSLHLLTSLSVCHVKFEACHELRNIAEHLVIMHRFIHFAWCSGRDRKRNQ